MTPGLGFLDLWVAFWLNIHFGEKEKRMLKRLQARVLKKQITTKRYIIVLFPGGNYPLPTNFFFFLLGNGKWKRPLLNVHDLSDHFFKTVCLILTWNLDKEFLASSAGRVSSETKLSLYRECSSLVLLVLSQKLQSISSATVPVSAATRPLAGFWLFCWHHQGSGVLLWAKVVSQGEIPWWNKS